MLRTIAMGVALAAAGLSAAASLRASPQQEPGVQNARFELGRRLFYDADLSLDGTMSCATCHEQRRAFTTSNRTMPGVNGAIGRRNAPGLANIGQIRRLTLADPRQTSLEKQARVPLFGENPVEMGMKGHEAEIAQRLSANPCYRQQFAAAFPDTHGRIDSAAVARALATFQRGIVAMDSPYDRFLRGERTALDSEAQRGLATFRKAGCADCHSGPLLTDQRYHKLLPVEARDPGLSEVSGRAADAGRFRTPSLRQVALTPPYLHDGRAATLDEAIALHPTGKTLSAEARVSIIAFLKTLTDPALQRDPRLSLPTTACGRSLYQ